MNKKHFSNLSYCLTMVSYMTLTISLPLVAIIAQYFNTETQYIQQCISLLFFTFSFSAFFLSALSDILGIHKVLKFAQFFSITGLWIMCFSSTPILFLLGCLLVGCGTGCYSSNARALIAKHAVNAAALSKGFSAMSIICIVAPIVSTYLAIGMNFYNWRFAYAAMALIEMGLLLYALWVLRHDTHQSQTLSFARFKLGFTYCLRKPLFILNMFSVGFSLTIFIQLFMEYLHSLLVHEGGLSYTIYSIIILLTSITYIVGIMLFRKLGLLLSGNKLRGILLFMLCFGSFIFSVSHEIPALLCGIYIISVALGFLSPLSTTSGMLVIEQYQGSAAALYVCSFSAISGIYSSAYAAMSINTHRFVSYALWVSSGIFAVLFFLIHLYTKKRDALLQ